MFRVINHLHCKVPSYQFGSIWINVSRNDSPNDLRIQLLFLTAVTSSIKTSESIPVAAIHVHTMTLLPVSDLTIWIIISFFPSPHFTLPVILTCLSKFTLSKESDSKTCKAFLVFNYYYFSGESKLAFPLPECYQ